MINLLPPETKRQLSAARTNRLLLRYNVMLLAALAFLIAAIAFVYIYLVNAQSSAEAAIVYNKSKVSGYSAVETEATQFRQTLTTDKQILDNDVAYTKVILAISGVLPRGVVLDTLSLDSKTFGTPTVLTANVKDYSTALRLKTALQSSAIFSDVSIQSISSGNNGSYPITVALSVTIKKDAAR